MTDEEINEYINTKEPYDKAGGYGIQGEFAKYISLINGDYYNVMGLPIYKVNQTLKKYDVEKLITCLVCNKQVGNKNKFCPNCGNKLQINKESKICRKCSNINKATNKFCVYCGCEF